MRVLVTRPQDDAQETAARLAALGHEAIVAPLIAVKFIEGPNVDLSDIQAFLATSSNGVRALARRSGDRALPLFAVGRQTARTARALGFAQVNDADGNAIALANLVSRVLRPQDGVLLHAAAREAPGAFAEALSAGGFRIRSEALYETPAASRLPPVAADALRTRRLDAVLFFSARTAEVFPLCAAEAGLASACSHVRAFCISQACADALSPLGFAEVRVAAAPNQDALLALLDR